MSQEVMKRGFAISRNVDIYLHKPLPHDNYKTIKEKVQALHDLNLIKQHEHVANDVVDGGEIWIAELLAQLDNDNSAFGSPLNAGLQFIAVGIDGTYNVDATPGVDQNDYRLTDHLFSKVDDYKDFDQGAANANAFTIGVTFAIGEANGALKEAGIFALTQTGTGSAPAGVPANEKASNNRMFNRTTFSVITKTSSFALTIQWTITIGSLDA